MLNNCVNFCNNLSENIKVFEICVDINNNKKQTKDGVENAKY